jgi:hypothetical protein
MDRPVAKLFSPGNYPSKLPRRQREMTKHYKVSVAFLALFLSAFFSASAATAPKVVFIGDWITYSWTSAFAANPNWINKGESEIGGQCCTEPGNATETLYRFQSDVVSLHPDIVHIMVGAGDAYIVYDSGFQLYIPGFLTSLDNMVKEARAANIKVVLGMESPNFSFEQELEPLNAVIAAYGAANNIPVINYGDALCNCVGSTSTLTGYSMQPQPSGADINNNPYLTPYPTQELDGAVPTTAGYALMTQMAETAIASMTLTLKSGYLQNSQYPQSNEGTNSNGITLNVNAVAPNAVIQFTP